MVGLTGLLPIQCARMSSYPLWTGSLLLFAAMTSLNMLFLARKTWNRVVIGLILTLYTTFFAIKRLDQMGLSQTSTETNFDQSTSVLVGDSLSPYYGFHQTFQLIITFLILTLASHNMEQSKYKYNQIVKMNLDRMYECMG